MAKKEKKSSQETHEPTILLLEQLASIDGFTSKRMFGGYGIFHEGKMFGLIDAKRVAFMKADDTTRPDYEKLGSVQHSRMPYYSIPDEILQNKKKLIAWAKKSIKISK